MAKGESQRVGHYKLYIKSNKSKGNWKVRTEIRVECWNPDYAFKDFFLASEKHNEIHTWERLNIKDISVNTGLLK